MVNRLPHNTTKIFTDVWSNSEDFYEEYTLNGIPAVLTPENTTTLYYLLYAKYGNSAIANLDETQWKYRVYATIFQYGPTWEKKLAVQSRLRQLSEDEMRKGSKAIYNHAFNPSTEPTTDSLEELTFINDQNTTRFNKSVLEGYNQLLGLLEDDVTGAFLDKFKPLFAKFIYTKPDIFVTDDSEEGE